MTDKDPTESRLKVIAKLSTEIDELLNDRLPYFAAAGDPFYLAMRALAWSTGEIIGKMHRESSEADMETYCRLVGSVILDEAQRARKREQELKAENDKLKQIISDKLEEFEAAVIGKPEAQA